jgi:ATP-dependent DNA helicase RecG
MEEMRQGNVSRRRNPLIADLFRRIQMVEGWGRGMPLIFENAPSVKFRQIAGLFIASFERPSFVEEASKETVDKSAETTGKTTGKAGLLLEQVRRNPQITTPELAVMLGLTDDGVTYHLRTLQKQGLLKRTGGRKSGY